MSKATNFSSNRDTITQIEIEACKCCSRHRGDGFEICANQLRLILMGEGSIRQCAEIILIEAGRARARATEEGSLAGIYIASAARTLACVWLDVAVLGWANLVPASEHLREAADELDAGQAILDRGSASGLRR